MLEEMHLRYGSFHSHQVLYYFSEVHQNKLLALFTDQLVLDYALYNHPKRTPTLRKRSET